ncbi:hypothetical protein EZS27_003333 [termite gut metagenome]|uniref:Transposase DDE domain-containing protein n=1 Tax=termite gut metagenome TaxID=433724 RepID=A0A5J4STM4_9ZZZZ
MLKQHSDRGSRNKPNRLSNSEIMTILIAFHLSRFRNLKHFYLFYVCKHMGKEFPKLVSYSRFVELQETGSSSFSAVSEDLPDGGSCSGISFIDSSCLKVCHIKREHSNLVFEGTATKGKSTLDWFFGFKLHIIINDRREIISFVITQGNVNDRQPLSMESFIRNVSGKLEGMSPENWLRHFLWMIFTL